MSLSEEAEVTPERDRFPQSWFLDINGGGGGDTRPRVSGRRASFPAAKLAVCASVTGLSLTCVLPSAVCTLICLVQGL